MSCLPINSFLHKGYCKLSLLLGLTLSPAAASFQCFVFCLSLGWAVHPGLIPELCWVPGCSCDAESSRQRDRDLLLGTELPRGSGKRADVAAPLPWQIVECAARGGRNPALLGG